MGKWISKYKGYLDKIIKEVINLIYPVRCPVCDDIVARRGSLCHRECYEKLIHIKEPLCKKCGKMLEDESIEYCFDCSKKKKVFKEGRAVFLYDKLMKNSISSFKYKSKKEYGQFYACEIVDYLGDYIRSKNIDAIIPVPIHKNKLKIRGYNQADIIAREVGKRMGIAVLPKVLIRNFNTAPQKELSNIQRFKNLENAFSINHQFFQNIDVDFKLNNILIIDDIYTTGATINSCAKVLKNYCDVQVYYVALSIGQGK